MAFSMRDLIGSRRDQGVMPRTSNAEILIVGGTLGSGKTTFIRSLFETGKLAGKRVAIVNGDFASANSKWEGVRAPDTDRFPRFDELGDRLKGITSGCVCCKSQDEMVGSVRDFLSPGKGVDTIIVECSGVTDPQRVRQALWEKLPVRKTPHIVTLVNAQVFQKGTPLAHEVSLYCAASGDSVGITHSTSETKGAEQLIQNHAASHAVVAPLSISPQQGAIAGAQLDTLMQGFQGAKVATLPSLSDKGRDDAFKKHRADYSQLVIVLHPGITAREVQEHLKRCEVPIARAKGVFWNDSTELNLDFVNGEISLSPRHTASEILPGRSWLRVDATTGALEEIHLARVGMPLFSKEFVKRVGEAYRAAVQDPFRVSAPEADIAFFRGASLLGALKEIPSQFRSVQKEAYEGFVLAAIGYSKFRVHQASRLNQEPHRATPEARRAKALLGVDLALVEHVLPTDPQQRAGIAPLFAHLSQVSSARLFFEGAALLDSPVFINGRSDLNEQSFKIYAAMMERAQREGVTKEAITKGIQNVWQRCESGDATSSSLGENSWGARGKELLRLVR